METETINPPNPQRPDRLIGKEFARRGPVLWENDFCKVVLPEHPLTPRSEGQHLRVVLNQPEPPFWSAEADPKKIMKAFGIGLGVAKALAESGVSGKDMWTNVQLLGEWGGQQETVIDIFGRAVQTEDGGKTWGEPVSLPKNTEPLPQETSSEEIMKLSRLFRSYLPLWDKALNECGLFTQGVVNFDQAKLTQLGSTTIWADQKYYITTAGSNPHVEGSGHLIDHIQPEKGDLPRVWTSLPEALELLSIDMATVQLLKQKGVIPGDPPNVNIHFSGNWALPYPERDTYDPHSPLTENEKGFLTRTGDRIEKGETLKPLKRQAREVFNRLHTHGHIYWTRDPQAPLVLPEHPKSEQYPWTHTLQPLPAETETLIKKTLQQELPALLVNKYSGRLTQQTTQTG